MDARQHARRPAFAEHLLQQAGEDRVAVRHVRLPFGQSREHPAQREKAHVDLGVPLDVVVRLRAGQVDQQERCLLAGAVGPPLQLEGKQRVRSAGVLVVVVVFRHSARHRVLNDLCERATTWHSNAARLEGFRTAEAFLVPSDHLEARLVAVLVRLVDEVSHILIVQLHEGGVQVVPHPYALHRRKAAEHFTHDLRHDPVKLVRVLPTFSAEQGEGLARARLPIGEEARPLPV
mmetsp:Transcript_8541/g.18893  ORF Transcript_8541/g.18893 Transcript_8541/m.18893 type:complete len:233 (-) Transcript_8541:141-839(-)